MKHYWSHLYRGIAWFRDAYVNVIPALTRVASGTALAFLCFGAFATSAQSLVNMNDITQFFQTPNTYTPNANNGSVDATSAVNSCITNASSSGTCYFPAGRYSYNNSASPTLITGFHGHVRFERNACVVMQNPANPFMKIVGTGGPGVTDPNLPSEVDGMCLIWPTQSTARVASVNFELSGFTNLLVTDFHSTYGPSVALWISDSSNVSVGDVSIIGSALPNDAHRSADGLHFANVSQFKAHNIHCQFTGDDCFAVTNSGNYPNASIGTATQILAEYSGGSCVRLEAQGNITVTNVTCHDTSASGIYIDTGNVAAPASTQSYQGANKIILDGFQVIRAGTWSAAQWPGSGSSFVSNNGHGVEIYGAGTSDIYISNGLIDHSSVKGLYADTPITNLTVSNVTTQYSGTDGFHFAGVDGVFDHIVTSHNSGAGFASTSTGHIYATNIKDIDDCQDTVYCLFARAFTLPGPAAAGLTTYVDVDGVQIVDNGARLVPDSLQFTPGTTGAPSGQFTATTSPGWTCGRLPVVLGWGDGTKITNVVIKDAGYNCTVAGTFAPPSGNGTISAALNSQMRGVPSPSLVSAGSGYSVSSGSFVVYVPPPSGCFGNPGYLLAGISAGSISSVSWFRRPTECLGTVTFPSITLQPYQGITATSYGTASVTMSGSNLAPPVSRVLFEGLNGTSTTKGSISNISFSLPSGSPVVTIASSDQPNIAASFADSNVVNTVAPSATPTFDPALGSVQAMALNQNVTSFSVSNGLFNSQRFCFLFTQDAVARTISSPPSNLLGFFTIGTSASKRNQQCFAWSASLGAWTPESQGITNF